jgi:VWFA-related protein
MPPKGWTLSKAVLAVFCVAALAAAQDYQIRTRVDLVVVPVTVKGSGDRLITGLTSKDFQIYENGQPQTISSFSIDPVPLSAAVLLDTGLSARSFSKVQKTLPSLSEAFSEFDEYAVYRFDTYVTQVADFTSDKTALEAALNKFKDIKPSNPAVGGSPFATAGPVINGKPIAPSIDAGARLPARDAKVLHDALFTAAGDLAKRPGDRRRVIIVVSDGRAAANEHSYEQVLERIQTNNIQVYSIGMDAALLARKFSALNDYAESTGGDAFYLDSTDALERSYSRAAEEARNQYVLGYFSTNKAPGPLPVFRQIAVRTVEPRYDVRARRGYYQYPPQKP